ncbi:hypothetical protein B0H14DRAFT_3142438 [Mycena olivaceomarginata]|nr:hypothetical protein B0H14DRAFT_3142438 [Mycena olivaceomarginata]
MTFLSWKFLSRLIGWPAIVICGQLILQTVAWGFFLMLQWRGGIALPHRLAASAKANPHTVEWISTQIATILAFSSTMLFSWGVRGSITLHLHGDGMSFAAFTSFIKISTHSLILNPRRRILSLMSIVVIILTGVQTAGTLLTGHEIDLSSSLLRQMQNNEALDFCMEKSTKLPAFVVGQTESGYTAVKGNLSFPATFTLMDQPFNLSTLLTRGYFTIEFIASQCKHMVPGHDDHAGHRQTHLEPSGRPGLELFVEPAGRQPNYLLMIPLCACNVGNDTSHTAGAGLIFFAGPTGMYKFLRTTVCTLSPKIINVEVHYSDVINTRTRPGVTLVVDVGSPPTLSAVTTLYDMVYFSQAFAGNSMADKLRSLIQEIDGNNFTNPTILRTTEEYIRGVTEYSASVFRACLSANKDFSDALPSNVSISTNGTFYTETIGWIHASPVTLLELIPGTLVAILTIYTVIVAVAQHAGDQKDDYFDPSDVTHLVAASAAGGLNNMFVGTKERHSVEDNNVFLSTIPGRGPALIRGTI